MVERGDSSLKVTGMGNGNVCSNKEVNSLSLILDLLLLHSVKAQVLCLWG